MLGRITILCFAASYGVALFLELSRLFFRVSFRTAIMVGFMIAGILAHTIYLGREAQLGLAGGAPLSSWYHGCLIIAWFLAIVFVTISLKQLTEKPTPIGIVFLPTILLLVGLARIFPSTAQLSSEASERLWGMCHGFALLLGTAAVSVGFIVGMLYVLQSYRLKKKIMRSGGLKLPSLERLQRISEHSLITSCFFLLVGLLSGVLLNWRQGDEASLLWTDPVVLPSGLLLIWLIAALAFSSFYKPARRGHKVAYLTFASFVFLAFVMGMIFLRGGHGAA